jgi:hypothetical protein
MTATTPILDGFNRANEGPPPSTSWTNLNAGLKVVSNVCVANAANSVDYYNVGTYGPDCEVYGTVTTKPASGQSIAFYLRLKDVGSIATVDGYLVLALVQAGTDILRVQRLDNGTATTLGADVSQEYATSDKFLLRATGSTLIMERNNAIAATRSDTTYGAAGNLGAAIGDTVGAFDDFGGGVYRPAYNAQLPMRGVLRGAFIR